MKLLLSAIAFAVITTCSAIAQHVQTVLSVVDATNIGSQLFLGLDTAATDARDISMGESEKPGHPPGGMHALLMLPTGEMCYRDFRKLIAEPTFMREFRIEVQPADARNNEPINFKWDYPLDKGIDSIIIYDRKTGGNKVRFSLDTKRKFVVDDENSDSFIIQAYYGFGPNAVREEITKEDILFPNPAYDFISVQGVTEGEMLEVSTINGQIYRLHISEGGTTRVAELPIGMYSVVVRDIANEKRFIGMFTKQ